MPYSAQQRVRARRRSAGNLGSLERKRTDDTVDSVRVAGRGEVKVLDETPAAKAIGYARNQRIALQRFLSDGRLPIHNNGSENALRREALGRRNWLFVGTDEGGEVNATLVTLLASCKLHGIEPLGYLRDLLCLLPDWPEQCLLELAPAYWRTTLERPEVQRQLEANVFRQVALGKLTPTVVRQQAKTAALRETESSVKPVPPVVSTGAAP